MICYIKGVKTLNFTDMKKGNFCADKIVCMSQIWKNHSSWSYLKQKRPDHGIYYLAGGDCEYIMPAGEKKSFKKGDIMYIPKGINYEVYFNNINENDDKILKSAYLINFNLTDPKGNETAFSKGIEHIYSDTDGTLEEMFENIVSLYFKNRVLSTKSEFYAILSRIAENRTEENGSTVWEGIKYIEDNFNQPITVGELAKMCAVSETSFRRIFKETTGESPVKYINRLKIAKAKELLKSSEITVDEIAYFLSFYDKSYFCKTFKSVTNLTPAQYRKRRLRR